MSQNGAQTRRSSGVVDLHEGGRRSHRPSRKRWLVLAFLIAAVPFEAAIAGLLPLSVRFFIDRVVGAGNQSGLTLALAFLGTGILLALGAGFLRDLLSPRFLSGFLMALRQRMFERVQRLPLLSHSTPVHSGALPATDRSSAVVERFSGDTALIENAASRALPVFVVPVVRAILCTGVIFWLEWRAGLMALLLWPWILLAPSSAAARAARNREVVAEEEKHLLGIVKESMAAQLFIRAFSLEQLRLAGFRKRNQTLSREAARSRTFPALLETFASGGVLCILVAVAALNGWIASAADTTLSGGSIAAIQLLAIAVANALFSVNDYLPALAAGRAAKGRIDETLDESADVVDAAGAKILPSLQSEIGFSGVKFSYAPAAEPVTWQIAGITARIPKGTYVAFVGPSGCGKSTLLKLLLRFHDPAEGTVSIDGHSLKSVTQTSLRSRIGVVFQENPIFNAPIRENIRMARPDASEEAVTEAAQVAGIDSLIRSLPQSYDTLMSDKGPGEKGVRFSSAGVQRLAIARAMLRAPDILLFDEATSALDPPDEIVINELVRTLRRGRTVIALTHRLSTVADADHIFVMDRGAIVEQGSHFELLAANHVYASYWRKQAGFTFSADGRHVDVDAERLKTFPILEKLDEPTLGQLAHFFVTETFPPGREIVRQNDSGDRFYIIARGRVEVWRTEELTGNTTAVAFLETGDFFGEITLITGFPRTATVRSVTVCTCISLERGHFNRLLEHHPALQRELSEIAVQRLRETARAAAAGGEEPSAIRI
jgi:ATP-binding cassette subfamily B protein